MGKHIGRSRRSYLPNQKREEAKNGTKNGVKARN